MSYIVKNCPARPSDIKASYGWCQTELMNCRDCRNCIIKQIVDACKWDITLAKTYNQQHVLATKILEEILQIEEQ